MRKGTPANGPRGRPLRISACARSGRVCSTGLSLGFTFSMAARAASTSSSHVTSLRATSSASPSPSRDEYSANEIIVGASSSRRLPNTDRYPGQTLSRVPVGPARMNAEPQCPGYVWDLMTVAIDFIEAGANEQIAIEGQDRIGVGIGHLRPLSSLLRNPLRGEKGGA